MLCIFILIIIILFLIIISKFDKPSIMQLLHHYYCVMIYTTYIFRKFWNHIKECVMMIHEIKEFTDDNSDFIRNEFEKLFIVRLVSAIILVFCKIIPMTI